MPETMHVRNCRACGHSLSYPVVDLGPQFVSDFPRPQDFPLPEERRVPLQLCYCHGCGLVQLSMTTPRDWHYRGDYWYRSGVNESMVAALRDVAETINLLHTTKGGTWIDIGANDGTLLRHVGELAPQLTRVAVEPVVQFEAELAEHSDMVMPEYWPCRYDGPKATVISSIAMFYDVDDPNAFVAAIREALAETGVWIVQFTDLHATYMNADVGNICHEHLTYWPIGAFTRLVEQHGLEVMAVHRNYVNGGSARYLVTHKGVWPTLQSVAGEKASQEVYDEKSLQILASSINSLYNRFWHRWEGLQNMIGIGRGVIDVYGASTKGNTVLQWLELGPDRIRRAIERSPAKYGRCTVNGIPIVSEKVGRHRPADCWLVLPWHFKEGILKRERRYLHDGGRLLFVQPVPEIVESGDR